MPPKSKKGGDKGRGEAEEVEEPLQAVVFADSFENKFSPLSLEKPRCLLPLANTPLIEYTLEFLAASGVQEIYFYCGANTAQLEEYLLSSKWTSRTSPFETFETLRSTSMSIGDAMRDLDKRAILSGDFLVVYGDVISNITLAPALAAHKARKAADKNSIMTMLLREAGLNHRTTAQNMLATFVIDPHKDRCLAYEQIMDGHETNVLELDADILAHDELSIRSDLIDCGIDICTPEVLALWSDNFDYELPRRGFLHSVLKDYELNGKMIHTYIEQEGYAARVRDLRSYDAISKDVLGRWTYPFVPDSNFGRDQTYKLYRGGCYREGGVVLAGSCDIGKRTVIGRASAVGDGSVLENTVVGRRCVIGRNVKITGTYIWDDAVIGDGTVITDSLIASEASVGKRCTIKAGAVISFGCHIADGITIPEKMRITRMKKVGGLGNEEVVRGDADFSVVGEGGEGFEVEDNDDEEEFYGLGPKSLYSFAHLSFSQESISTLNSVEEEFEDIKHAPRDSRATSFGSVGSDEGSSRNAMDFHHEASLQIYESLQKGDESANMQLELTSLRMAADASPHSVRKAVVIAFMKRIATLVESGLSPAQAAKQTIPAQENLLKRTMFDHGEKHEAKPDQVDFLLLMQMDLRNRKDGEKIMLHVSNELVLQDIVETEAFEQWWEDENSTEDESMVKVRSMMKPFMDAIADDDSEEDDSEDEEEEEDDDELFDVDGADLALPAPYCPHYRAGSRNLQQHRPLSPALHRPGSCRLRLSGRSRTSAAPPPTTPPVTRKRKAEAAVPAEHTAAKGAKARKPSGTQTPDSHVADSSIESIQIAPAPELPATPLTLPSGGVTPAMDTDDDMLSVVSGSDEGFGEDQDSSVDFGDSDDDFNIDDDGDIDFGGHEKDLKPIKKAFEIDFKVYSPAEIRAQQDSQAREVANIIGQPKEATTVLLRYARWNKERLIEQYMDNTEETLDNAGLGQNNAAVAGVELVPGFHCDICYTDSADSATFALRCGHRFCTDCWKQYLTQKIKEEGEAARIRCPGGDCNQIVDSKSLDILVTPDLKDRYDELVLRTYVDDKDNLKWCPAPNCIYALECGFKQRDLNKIVPTVHCKCKHPFCFACTLTDHQPTPCGLVKLWLKKCEDDSETSNWISANTKECPKCQSTIEKNGGCNHMTCRKCKNEFCWVCMGVWSEHGNSYYNCNRFEEKSGSEARDAQAKSRQSLERYLHYYNRYANHEQSARLDKDIFLKTEKKMTHLQSTSGMSWIEVQFLDNASQALQQCRQTLKWTYAFAYYLKRNNLTEIFEDNQRDLELAVENLSEMFEKPTDQLAGLKVEMMDKTSYCTKRRIILLDDTAENLKQGNWTFNVELS